MDGFVRRYGPDWLTMLLTAALALGTLPTATTVGCVACRAFAILRMVAGLALTRHPATQRNARVQLSVSARTQASSLGGPERACPTHARANAVCSSSRELAERCSCVASVVSTPRCRRIQDHGKIHTNAIERMHGSQPIVPPHTRHRPQRLAVDSESWWPSCSRDRQCATAESLLVGGTPSRPVRHSGCASIARLHLHPCGC